MTPYPDVAYLVRAGDKNEELRYSLRSLRNVPHGRVWIFGHCPPWVSGVFHRAVPQDGTKYVNATANLQALAAEGPMRFALMNDDFFCVRRVHSFPPPAHRGCLPDVAAARQSGGYREMLLRTARLLDSHALGTLAYTLHVPMMMTRDHLRETLRFGSGYGDLSWRSVYGNLFWLGGRQRPDVKIHASEALPDSDWVSTNDSSFAYHRSGRRIRDMFPDPSPYEVA